MQLEKLIFVTMSSDAGKSLAEAIVRRHAKAARVHSIFEGVRDDLEPTPASKMVSSKDNDGTPATLALVVSSGVLPSLVLPSLVLPSLALPSLVLPSLVLPSLALSSLVESSSHKSSSSASQSVSDQTPVGISISMKTHTCKRSSMPSA